MQMLKQGKEVTDWGLGLQGWEVIRQSFRFLLLICLGAKTAARGMKKFWMFGKGEALFTNWNHNSQNPYIYLDNK